MEKMKEQMLAKVDSFQEEMKVNHKRWMPG
jgi:hypothetical protein